MSDRRVRTIRGRPKKRERKDHARVSEWKAAQKRETRKVAYSQEPSSAYAGNASPREDHGHINRAGAERTPGEKEQQ